MLTKFLAIIGGTVREAFAKKTLLAFFIVSTILIAIMLVISIYSGAKLHDLTTSTKMVNSRDAQQAAVQLTVREYFWGTVSRLLMIFTLFIGLVVTSTLITSIMEKGNIDLLLSKPVPRWLYLLGRYCGGVLIVAANIGYLVLGLWLVVGIVTGAWSFTFPVSILYLTLGFAGFYSVVTLFGVITKSSWFSVIIVIAIYFIVAVLLPLGKFLDGVLNGEPGGFFTTTTSVLKYLLPHADGATDGMVNTMLSKPVEFLPIAISVAVMAAYLGISTYIFSKKEF